MPHTIKRLNDGEYVLRQGDAPARCAVVMTGFLARQKVVSERNQISSFYVPGDMPDLHTLHLSRTMLEPMFAIRDWDHGGSHEKDEYFQILDVRDRSRCW